MNPVPMEMDANIQALINISAKRLCMCADPTTREYWEALVEEIKNYDEDVYWALVPQCVRCGSCVEPFGKCQFYKNFAKNLTPEQQMDIIERYNAYNQYREKQNVLKRTK